MCDFSTIGADVVEFCASILWLVSSSGENSCLFSRFFSPKFGSCSTWILGGREFDSSKPEQLDCWTSRNFNLTESGHVLNWFISISMLQFRSQILWRSASGSGTDPKKESFADGDA